MRESGGLFVALVHAGVFGDTDAERREAHLRVVHDLLQHPDVWVADIAEIVDWWTGREQVRVEAPAGSVRVTNQGTAPIEGLQLAIDHIGVRTLIALPLLAPGAEHVVELDHGGTPPGDAAQFSLFPSEFSAGTEGRGKEQSSR